MHSKIYVADPSCQAEMGHMIISCSSIRIGLIIPSYLSAYKSEFLPGEHTH